MQTLFAFHLNGEKENLAKQKAFALQSNDNMYTLYLLILSLFIELQKKASIQLEKMQNKHLATAEDKNPNKKFINNQVLQQIKQNTLLNQTLQEYKITHWHENEEYVDLIYRQIINSNLYKEYMQTKTSNFKEDKFFIIDIFKEIIATNQKLYDYIEDYCITWVDDFPIVNTTLLKLLKKTKTTVSETYWLPKLYKDKEDKKFALNLLETTITNETILKTHIENKTKNWESDRIAKVDAMLLEMAICELLHFPTIPVKVSLNEYLEIAKEYSTPKSSIFINGILDSLVKDFQNQDILNKLGRGLM